MTPRSRRKSCALLLLAAGGRAFAPMNLAAPTLRAATPAAARSSGDGCRPSSCEATEAFRRGLEARFVTGTLTERAPAGAARRSEKSPAQGSSTGAAAQIRFMDLASAPRGPAQHPAPGDFIQTPTKWKMADLKWDLGDLRKCL